MGSRFSKKSKIEPESRTAPRFNSLRQLETEKSEDYHNVHPNTARVRSKSNGWIDEHEQPSTSGKTSVHTSSFSSASSFSTASSQSSSNERNLTDKVEKGSSAWSTPHTQSLPQNIDTINRNLQFDSSRKRKHSSSPAIHSVQTQQQTIPVPSSQSDVGVPARCSKPSQTKANPTVVCADQVETSCNSKCATCAQFEQPKGDVPTLRDDVELVYLNSQPRTSKGSTTSEGHAETILKAKKSQETSGNIALEKTPSLHPGIDKTLQQERENERDKRRLARKRAGKQNEAISVHQHQGEHFDVSSLFSSNFNFNNTLSTNTPPSHYSSSNSKRDQMTTKTSISNNALQYQKNWFDSIFCRAENAHETSNDGDSSSQGWDNQSSSYSNSSTNSTKRKHKDIEKRRVSFSTQTIITCVESDETSSISSHSSSTASKTSRSQSSSESNGVPLIAVSRAEHCRDPPTSRSINEERRKRVQEKLKQRTSISAHSQHFENAHPRFHKTSPNTNYHQHPHQRTKKFPNSSLMSPSSTTRHTLSVALTSSTVARLHTRETTRFVHR
nr:unnamed protein product [Naegleria fowleri]